MFYDTAKRDHGLPHDPIKAIVAPRPIGWISSLSPAGMDEAADGTSYDGPRGRATMLSRHVSRDIYLAQAEGAKFRVIETFPNVGAGNNCG